MNYLYTNIKPTRLYIKQCPHCDLKYFGKTIKENIEQYEGSGKYWRRHLKKHNVSPNHIWNSDWYTDTSITKFAVLFSKLNKIVENKAWANCMIEDGLAGGKSWDKSTNTSHPFIGSDLQNKRIADGTHNLIDTVNCVDKNGNILLVNRNEYENNDELVSTFSKEGFKRLGKCESTRYIHDVTGMDFSDTKNCLTGEDRTENQKNAALAHSTRMKGNIPANKGKKGQILIRGRKWYNNGIKELFLSTSGIIPKGYELGTLTKRKCGSAGSKWINDGNTEKKLMKNEELPKGFIYGKIAIICPHCNTSGAGGAMKRHHFDNCKLREYYD